ncbi:MAG: hypothetical protein IJ008_03605 [Clostridia bacterium]|nr:hypothetical protein [Clostridia bacterium]
MKKFLKLFCFMFCFALLLTGCATVSNIKNNSKELIYNGGSVVRVGDYLYFANNIDNASENLDSNKGYKKLAGTANLKRVNLSKLKAKNENTSVKNSETVQEEFVGYENTNMFVLGNYIYYSTPNLHKDKSNNNHFDYTTIYRCKLNGDNNKEIYTTSAVISRMDILKADGDYYIVMVDSESNILRMKIGKKVGKVETIAKKVTTYAIAEDNQKNNGYIYYTKDYSGTDGLSGSRVYRVNIESGKDKLIYNGVAGGRATTIKFTGRQNDVVFYTHTNKSGTENYYVDLSKTNFTTSILNKDNLFYASASEISDVKAITGNKLYKGYTFVVDSNLMYKNVRTNEIENISTALSENYSDFKILFVDECKIFFNSATNNAFYYYDVTTKDVTEIVKMNSTIYSDAIYGYDGTNLYYYAQIVDEDAETTVSAQAEGEGEETEEKGDQNYYLYTVKINRSANETYQLLGKTV